MDRWAALSDVAIGSVLPRYVNMGLGPMSEDLDFEVLRVSGHGSSRPSPPPSEAFFLVEDGRATDVVRVTFAPTRPDGLSPRAAVARARPWLTAAEACPDASLWRTEPEPARCRDLRPRLAAALLARVERARSDAVLLGEIRTFIDGLLRSGEPVEEVRDRDREDVTLLRGARWADSDLERGGARVVASETVRVRGWCERSVDYVRYTLRATPTELEIDMQLVGTAEDGSPCR